MDGTTWNARHYGCRADGVHDDTEAIQKAIKAAAEAGGGTVLLPAGRYAIRGNLTIPAAVNLLGVCRVAPTAGKPELSDATSVRITRPEDQPGTVLVAYTGRGEPEAAPLITLAGDMATVGGLTIIYPEFDPETIPLVPYPPTIGNAPGVCNVGIENLLFLHTYEAIRLIGAPRHLIRNVTGYPLRRGILVDECGDIGHIENVHFWPFGLMAYNPTAPLGEWVALNGVAFEFGRTDWQYVTNTFCFGYGVGYRFSPGYIQSEGLGGGGMNGQFSGMGADSCQRAILVEAALPFGVLISNAELSGRWKSPDAVCLEVMEGANCTFRLDNCFFAGAQERCVWMRDPKSQLTLTNCHFNNWNSCGMQVDGGMVSAQGCTFGYPGYLNNPAYNQALETLDQGNRADICVKVGERASAVLLTGNLAAKGFQVENHAGSRTVCVGNQDWPAE